MYFHRLVLSRRCCSILTFTQNTTLSKIINSFGIMEGQDKLFKKDVNSLYASKFSRTGRFEIFEA